VLRASGLMLLVSFVAVPSDGDAQRAPATPAAATAPTDSSIVAFLRSMRASDATLVSSFCGLQGATPAASFQIESGRVLRRGQYNSAEAYWPIELNAEGICLTPASAQSMLATRPKPFVATIQLRVARDDFGDPIVRVMRAETIPAPPTAWMRFSVRRLAQAQRGFRAEYGRYTSTVSRLRFRSEGDVSDPIIQARDEGWWAFVTHPLAGDSLCIISDGVPNPLVGAPREDVVCGTRADYTARSGSALPTRGSERQWPVGSLTILDSMTAIFPSDVVAAQGEQWLADRSQFPVLYLRVPATPQAVADNIVASVAAVRGARFFVRNGTDLGFAITRSQALGTARYYYYFSLLADSVNAPETIVRQQIILRVIGVASPRDVERLLAQSLTDHQRDFPGTVEVGPAVLPNGFRTQPRVAAKTDAPSSSLRDALHATLRNIVVAQEQYFTSNARYASDLSRLNVVIPPGVSVPAIRLTTGGWTATASHIAMVGVNCAVAVNAVNPVDSDTKSGEPVCSP
jgi:hypothetical protein